MDQEKDEVIGESAGQLESSKGLGDLDSGGGQGDPEQLSQLKTKWIELVEKTVEQIHSEEKTQNQESTQEKDGIDNDAQDQPYR